LLKRLGFKYFLGFWKGNVPYSVPISFL